MLVTIIHSNPWLIRDETIDTAVENQRETKRPGTFQVKVVRDFQALEDLQPRWRRLLRQSYMQSPFLTPEWVVAWWRHFGAGRQLHVVTIWRDDELCGIAPLMFSHERRYGLPVRRLGSIYNPHIQRFDFIVPAAVAADVYRALWAHLRENLADWDLLELSEFEAASPVLSVMEQAAREAGLASCYWYSGASPYLPIAGDWETYFSSLRKKHRSNVRRRMKRLSEQGEPGLETLRGHEAGQAALSQAFELEARAWKGKKGTAILSDRRVRDFYLDLSARMADQGWLTLFFLTCNGQRIAFQYCLVYRNRLFLLKSGYDPAYHRYSPSTLLKWLVLRQAFDEGLEEQDFLGGNDSWKKKWTSRTRPHYWLTVFAPSWRGRLMSLLKRRLAPLARQLTHALRAKR